MDLLLTNEEISKLLEKDDKSIPFKKPKETFKSSSVWEHFRIIIADRTEQ